MAIPCHEDPERASLFLHDGPSLDASSIRVNCIDEDQALGMIDGTLTSDERANIERHIDTCSACRELLSGLAQQSVFSGKPSPSSFPASAAFAQTQRALPETRNVALSSTSVSLARRVSATTFAGQVATARDLPKKAPARVHTADHQPAAPNEAAPKPVASNALFLAALGVGLGLFGLFLVVLLAAAGGLFYAGGRLVTPDDEGVHAVPRPAPEPTRETDTPPEVAAPSLSIPNVPGVTASLAYEHVVCRTDMGTFAHHAYVTEGLAPAFQAMPGCRVVMDDVTLRSESALIRTVIIATGDETIDVTIRNSRIEGDVIVSGAAHLRFENCEIRGSITGSVELIHSRHVH